MYCNRGLRPMIARIDNFARLPSLAPFHHSHTTLDQPSRYTLEIGAVIDAAKCRRGSVPALKRNENSPTAVKVQTVPVYTCTVVYLSSIRGMRNTSGYYSYSFNILYWLVFSLNGSSEKQLSFPHIIWIYAWICQQNPLISTEYICMLLVYCRPCIPESRWRGVFERRGCVYWQTPLCTTE